MSKKVIIIGAGVYGLGIGNYLAMNGFDTHIYEKHTLPGGVCTAWKRKGYTFDFCIHWLMGSSPGTNFHRLWREAGVIDGRTYREADIYLVWRSRSGETFTVYTDPKKLGAEMLRVAPMDAPFIRKFIRSLITMSNADMPICSEDYTLSGLMKFFSALPDLMYWGSMNMQTFTKKFKSPVLRDFFSSLYGPDDFPDFPATGLLFMLAFMASHSNGYPLGGSLEFAKAWEARYRRNGGSISYSHAVEKVLIENGCTKGVIVNGREERADIVISAADGNSTLTHLLGGQFTHPKIDHAYRHWERFSSLIFVSLGIARTFDGPSMHIFPAKEPLICENGALTVEQIGVRLFNFDDSLAPAGKTAATASISTYNDDYWSKLRSSDPALYASEKKRIADWIVTEADAYFGDIKNNIDVADVATPDTIKRYTGNWHGSYEGWLPTRKNMMKTLPASLPGLKNFYMVGQWISAGGGIPPAAMNGRTLAAKICREHGIRFTVRD